MKLVGQSAAYQSRAAFSPQEVSDGRVQKSI